jgi:hypothetical protein
MIDALRWIVDVAEERLGSEAEFADHPREGRGRTALRVE